MVVAKTDQINPWDIRTWNGFNDHCNPIIVPLDINIHNACNDRCDIINFACACGSWHTVEDFEQHLKNLLVQVTLKEEQEQHTLKEIADSFKRLPDMVKRCELLGR